MRSLRGLLIVFISASLLLLIHAKTSGQQQQAPAPTAPMPQVLQKYQPVCYRLDFDSQGTPRALETNVRRPENPTQDKS